MDFCDKMYELTDSGDLAENYGLRDQIRRSALSIPSNIAEGFERKTDQEFIRFLTIVKGSAGELRTQLRLARRAGYLVEGKTDTLLQKIQDVSKQINGFKYLRKEE